MPKYALVAFAYLLKGSFDVVGKEIGFEHKRVIFGLQTLIVENTKPKD